MACGAGDLRINRIINYGDDAVMIDTNLTTFLLENILCHAIFTILHYLIFAAGFWDFFRFDRIWPSL